MILRVTVRYGVELGFIDAIKMFRRFRNIGLKEAKDIVETIPGFQSSVGELTRKSLRNGQSFLVTVDPAFFLEHYLADSAWFNSQVTLGKALIEKIY